MLLVVLCLTTMPQPVEAIEPVTLILGCCLTAAVVGGIGLGASWWSNRKGHVAANANMDRIEREKMAAYEAGKGTNGQNLRGGQQYFDNQSEGMHWSVWLLIGLLVLLLIAGVFFAINKSNDKCAAPAQPVIVTNGGGAQPAPQYADYGAAQISQGHMPYRRYSIH
jgi:hypothetical protein